jgi:hypothetical protein
MSFRVTILPFRVFLLRCGDRLLDSSDKSAVFWVDTIDSDPRLIKRVTVDQKWYVFEFENVERETGNIPFLINGQPYFESWITIDGIYPKYGRFGRGIKEPVAATQKTKCQNGYSKRH